MIPVMAGMKSEESASVEKIAPNFAPAFSPAAIGLLKKYVPIVISHAPQTKNWRKLMTVSLNLIPIFSDWCLVIGFWWLESDAVN
jgi:hypothetical protein